MFDELDNLFDETELGSGQEQDSSNQIGDGQQPQNNDDGNTGGESQNTDDSNTNKSASNTTDEDDLITYILKSKGIKDPSSIKWQDENSQEIKDVNFNELPRDKQIEILLSRDQEEKSYPMSVSTEEKELFDTLSDNNISFSEYIEFVKEETIKSYEEAKEATGISVASLKDEELYLADLKSHYPSLTDDELLEALQFEQSNQALWDKKVAGLRELYTQREKEAIEEYELQKQSDIDAEEKKLQEDVVSALTNINEISIFELEDADKEEIAEFILGVDATGKRYITRAIENPEILAEMSWFALYGKKAIKELEDHYVDQIEQYSKHNYNKGYEEGQKAAGKKSSSTSKSAVKKEETSNDNERNAFEAIRRSAQGHLDNVGLDNLYD